MKGIEGPMSFLIIMFIGIIFVALGLALFLGILKAAPNQVAFASVQRLASAIQEACVTEDDEGIEIEFSMQQGKSMFKSALGIPLRVFAATKIREFGDPDFVLYYEMFPPGEGIAWEVYHDFGPRAVVVIPEVPESQLKNWNAKKIETFIDEAKQKVMEKIKKDYKEYKNIDDVPVVVSNIILTPDIDATTGLKVPEKEKKGFSGFGEWSNSQGDQIFRFINYRDLERMDKTFVKYMACGENSLCLKTPEGVYAFPLNECNGRIMAVQFSRQEGRLNKVWDSIKQQFTDPDIDKILGAIASQQTGIPGIPVFMSLASESYKYRTADLSLASPCQMKASVRLADCKCNKFDDYPIYEYKASEDKLGTIKDKHYNCVDDIRGDKDNIPKKPQDAKCIVIDFDSKDGHCYTYNQEPETIEEKIGRGIRRVTDKVTFGLFGGADKVEPVEKSTEYFDGIYLLTNAEMSSTLTNAFDNMKNFLHISEVPDEWWWP